MVTHDVNLKYLAHRALKVLDGKIINEEKIDPRVRTQHIANLQEKLEKMNKPSEGVQEEAGKKLVTRRVEDYGAIKWLKEKKIRDKIEHEMVDRCREELAKLNIASMSEETVQ